MEKIKFLQKTALSLLFLAAFFITVYSVSTFADNGLNIFAPNEESESSLAMEVKPAKEYRKVALQKKDLNLAKQQKRYISSEQIDEQPTLEEKMNFEQYPTNTVMATGYTAGVESTGKTADHPLYGITYSGVNVKRDLYSTIAADLSVYPIGTILFIPDYGYGVVADKGSAIKGNKIDLYYETVADVYENWGKKEVDVFVVKRGDGTLTEKQLNSLNEDEAVQVFRNQFIEEQ